MVNKLFNNGVLISLFFFSLIQHEKQHGKQRGKQHEKQHEKQQNNCLK